jgi:DNA (cytosine-5)-methyltransferase 1
MTADASGASRLSAQTPAVRPVFYEFFCGGGMARLGLGDNWRCGLANDDDARKAASYAANFGREGLIVGDVASLTAALLSSTVDLCWASPPCVGASLAGGRKGLGPEAWAFLRLMQDLRAEGRAPRMIVIENVPAILTSLGGSDFDRIVAALDAMDYRWGVVMIDAALFTAQSRERMFIIAVDRALDIPHGLLADKPSEPFLPEKLVKACKRQRAASIWFKLPVPPPHGLILADILDGRGMRWDRPAKTTEIIGMMDKPHLDRLAEDRRASTANRKLVVRGINWRTRDEITRWESREDLIANCLRTASGGSSIQRLLFVEGNSTRTRKISSAEYAGAMGLGPGYKLPAGRTASYNLIGDGVSPPAVRFLAQHVLEPILRAADLSLAAE